MLLEEERAPRGGLERALTVFLAGAECPFTCSFCDLWRYTLDGPTPAGALTVQLARALEPFGRRVPDRLKLYNASNFFDRRAVPREDLPLLAELAAPFENVTVESHAATIGPVTLEFATLLNGRLEVAIGLETIHPVAGAQLNKKLDLAQFDRAADFLRSHDLDLRVFVLLGAPHIAREEAVEWTVRSVEYAAAHGAQRVAIIPVRGGNGELERLQGLGEWTPPTLAQLEQALERCLSIRSTVVTADLWDVERLPACETCRPERVARIRSLNLNPNPVPRVPCPVSRLRVAVVGSGFAGSLLARVLAVQGHDVVLLERGTHPRFAIGESSTPLANLALERLARRYGLDDCYDLAAHGRWVARFPEIRRGLKRGFTFYRHHPGRPFAAAGRQTERLLVAASPNDHIADNHWLRADVDHHFLRAAVAAGVEYRDRTDATDELIRALRVDFIVDASGPGGFMARRLDIPSGLQRMHTNAGLLFSHFDGVRLFRDVVAGLPSGPYPDDWAAVHHVIDEGWMYSLRFDHGVTSAGFLLKQRLAGTPDEIWQLLLARYPTIGALFGGAKSLMPLVYKPRIQHRLTRAAGRGWAMLPHAYSFVDPLFSTGIAWSLKAIERLALCFEQGGPSAGDLERYERLLAAEADQIDWLVAGAYEAMAHFDVFAAQAMIYFAAVSFAEARQRLAHQSSETAAWTGFLGVGDPLLGPLPRASFRRLGRMRSREDRRLFIQWVRKSIAPRNVCGFANPAYRNLYPVDLDELVRRHATLGMSRERLVSALPALRGS